MERLAGKVERIQFFNQSNGFGVIKIDTVEEGLITAVGVFPVLHPGDDIKIDGEWNIHPQFGIQFKAVSTVIEMPTTKENIIKYLSSGFIKGVGPTTAKRIVDAFGEEALTIMENNPERLLEVDGIGEKRAEMILESFTKQLTIKETIMYLQSIGISPNYSLKIYKYYGDKTIHKVKENPYRLADDIFGIGFIKADTIALNMGIATDSPLRIAAGVKYILQQGSQEGQVFLHDKQLLEHSLNLFQIDEKLLWDMVEALRKDGDITVEEDRIYLSYLYNCERGAVLKLLEVMKFAPPLLSDAERLILNIERETGIMYHPVQRDAIKMAVNAPVSVITGGPGTGKTTILKGLLSLFKGNGFKVALAAPTGRAAKRMSETTGVEAKTIHRMLEMTFMDGVGPVFQRDEDRPLEVDVLIVDEMSMVDVQLFYQLLKAIKFGTRLIMVGDSDQLPSVGPGNVLRDIIDSKIIATCKLTEIFRQDNRSLIVLNAHKINSGQMPVLKNENKDFFFIDRENPEDILEMIKELYTKRIPSYLDIDPKDIQVLSPMRGTVLGVKNLNHILQELVNPKGKNKEEVSGSVTYRVGDKVMQIKNNYQKEVFNGDIGFIISISDEGGIIVEYPSYMESKEVRYNQGEIEELTHAYATTIHKSQGSEYRAVIIPITTQHFIMLQRNLLYTAVTRAKDMVVLVGTKKALAISVSRIDNRQRNTTLSRLLSFHGGV
jgi:exodeoxyribonuclease V alpha subunit